MIEQLLRYYSIGSYTPEVAGAVTEHAFAKAIPFKTYVGPLNESPLPGGSRISVNEGMVTVVLITNDVTEVQGFLPGVKFPKIE